MDKETYEKQKAFAGEKIASMNRRCVGHDYQGRQIYMITMVTEGRRPLFGQVAGRSDGAPDTPDVQENGFTDLAKPGGQRMDACARGQLLILAPWEHHNERIAISRNQCLSLNDMARMICQQTI